MTRSKMGIETRSVLPVLLSLVVAPHPLRAETAPDIEQAGGLEEIIVTARKRDENLLDVPVAISALSTADIARYGFTDLQQISAQVPHLVVNQEVGATAGSITLRGVSTGTFGGDFDQAVSLNVDGVVISRIATLQQGFFDVAGIEVLKGPQSLYFGKNSPGGIVSFRTADPGDAFAGRVRAAYDVSARGIVLDGILSGPLSADWGARLAVQVRDQQGFYRNSVPGQTYDRLPDQRDYFGRLTVRGTIGDRLTARIKIAGGHQRTSGPVSTRQAFHCPTAAAIPAGEDCVPNHHVRSVDAPPVLANVFHLNRSGEPRQEVDSLLASVELNYAVSDRIKITSLTGYNWYKRYFLFVDNSRDVIPTASGNQQTYVSFTQELRLASDFGGPFDFMVGAFYQHVDSEVLGSATFYAPFPTGASFLAADTDIRTNAYSLFAQISYEVVPSLTLSGGVRYTSERKTSDKDRQVPGTTIVTWRDLKLNAEDVSPEATLSWRPARDVNLYLSYREGFKSGGFSTSALPIAITTFRPESVSGFEAGVKTELAGRQLRLNLAAYSYKYEDLQVSIFDPATVTIETTNAAGARVKGVEAELAWRPAALPGFGVNASLAYNDAHYTNFLNQCYVGQTIAAGCDLNVVAGVFRSQDLSGTPLLNASKWAGNINLDYSGALSPAMRYGLSLGASYASKYQPHERGDPNAVQPGAWRLNASLRLFPESERWEIGIIGRNLTNRFRATAIQEVSGTGSGTGTATGVTANLTGFYGEPRSVSVQAIHRF